MLKYLFLALLAAASVVHLIGSWRETHKMRMVTKPMLLIFILLFYLSAVEPADWSVLLILALATSWLGDVLLMPAGNKWFVMGGISFLFSHLFFISVYVTNIDFAAVKWLLVIPAALVYYGIGLAVILALRKTTPKPMLAPMYLYLIANSTMNVFAFMQMLTRPCAGSVLAMIGAILFYISDCTLFLVRYHKNKNLIFKKHFTVMFTYILGEFLITLGMVLLGSASVA